MSTRTWTIMIGNRNRGAYHLYQVLEDLETARSDVAVRASCRRHPTQASKHRVKPWSQRRAAEGLLALPEGKVCGRCREAAVRWAKGAV